MSTKSPQAQRKPDIAILGVACVAAFGTIFLVDSVILSAAVGFGVYVTLAIVYTLLAAVFDWQRLHTVSAIAEAVSFLIGN